MTLHEWLKRENRTDAWLAEQVGRHRTTITKIRNGRLRPSIEVAAKIQRLSGCAVTAADYSTRVWLREREPPCPDDE
jgi:DNA-binding XRE family transcriptional regulator